jgi:Flp pilus assembly protein protease CpaA
MADGATENVLSWTVSNWLTVVLMATIAFFLLGVGQKWYQARQG